MPSINDQHVPGEVNNTETTVLAQKLQVISLPAQVLVNVRNQYMFLKKFTLCFFKFKQEHENVQLKLIQLILILNL